MCVCVCVCACVRARVCVWEGGVPVCACVCVPVCVHACMHPFHLSLSPCVSAPSKHAFRLSTYHPIALFLSSSINASMHLPVSMHQCMNLHAAPRRHWPVCANSKQALPPPPPFPPPRPIACRGGGAGSSDAREPFVCWSLDCDGLPDETATPASLTLSGSPARPLSSVCAAFDPDTDSFRTPTPR